MDFTDTTQMASVFADTIGGAPLQGVRQRPVAALLAGSVKAAGMAPVLYHHS